MLAKEKKTCGEGIERFIQLRLFSLEGDSLCPINFEATKRTLMKKELGNWRMNQIDKPTNTRRGETMGEGGDIFGGCRHDSGPILDIFYEDPHLAQPLIIHEDEKSKQKIKKKSTIKSRIFNWKTKTYE